MTKRAVRKLFNLGLLSAVCAVTALSNDFSTDAGAASAFLRAPSLSPSNLEMLESYPMVALARTHFALNQATLSREEKVALDKLAKHLAQTNDIIEIRAYADGAASSGDNLTLSAQRASEVARRLMSGGVSEARIIALGLGEVDPSGPARMPEHQRADIRVFSPPAAANTESPTPARFE
jgi:outer membrane protein OmpA-like peptidoglycan-associated protein